MVVRARCTNIVKKALAQRNFAHQPYVRPTCWLYVGQRKRANMWVQRVGTTLGQHVGSTLGQHASGTFGKR